MYLGRDAIFGGGTLATPAACLNLWLSQFTFGAVTQDTSLVPVARCLTTTVRISILGYSKPCVVRLERTSE